MGFFNIIGKAFLSIFKIGFWGASIVQALFLIGGDILEAIKQHSFTIFLKAFGLKILKSDEYIYNFFSSPLPSFNWTGILAWLDLLSSIWTLIIIIYLIYWIVSKRNTSEVAWNVGLALFIYLLINIICSLLLGLEPFSLITNLIAIVKLIPNILVKIGEIKYGK